MLRLTHTVSKTSSVAILVRSLACPYCVFHFTITTNNGKCSWSGHTRPSLANSYYVSFCSLSPLDYPLADWEIHLSFHFRMCIYLLFFWCGHILWCMRFSALLQVFLCYLRPRSASRLFEWLTWMGPFHWKDLEDQVVITHLKYLNSAIKWWWLSTT